MAFSRVSVLCVLLAAAMVSADMYLHNMRGSNNRLDEARRDRNNANRLFDSQNNNRGGYNVGRMYYYEGERIPLEWTNQHGCGYSQWNDCNIIVQYMCSDHLRDGVTTQTIPQTPSQCLNEDCNTDVRYGMHEDYDYYMNCRYRFRNKGLFTADRNLNGRTARFTRQNNNGQRRGYECPEERDYYPYWHPTPWVDLAVITNDDTRCEYYAAESENVKGRNFCSLPDDWYHHMIKRGGNGNNGFIPNTEDTCNSLNQPNSAMMVFLREEAAKEHARQQAFAKAELTFCEESLRECALLPDVDDNGPSEREQCLDELRPKMKTEDQLPRTCPQGKKMHPISNCHCLPETCFADAEMWSQPDATTGGCPAGYVVDPDVMSVCIKNVTECIEDRTPYNDLSKDNTRAEFMRDTTTGEVKFLLVDDQEQCVPRRIVGADCAANNLKKAFWALAPSHQQRLGTTVHNLTCTASQLSRPNSLGNGPGGFTHGWNWTFPSDFRTHCAIRLRYNITTSDYNGLDPHNASLVNSKLNRPGNNQPAKVNVGAQQKLKASDFTDSDKPYMNARGYLYEQNPQVQVFDYYQIRQYCKSEAHVVPGDWTKCWKNPSNPDAGVEPAQKGYCEKGYDTLVPPHGQPGTVQCGKTNEAGTVVDTKNMETTDKDFELQLAINTNQFGRTFQDRSHSYEGRERTDELKTKCGTIHALNVRGKRGNIVQTFPGVEYDFSPNRLHVPEGDCIHFQWTGSNTNPNNNDGQGKQGTDRSNIVLMEKVRGEGGRGVERYGGKGAKGTTWTTALMEPGWEGFVQHAQPTMGDVQCPPRGWPLLGETHFNNWQKCTDCTRSDFVPRQCNNEGVCTSECDAASGWKVDPENARWCIRASCQVVDRTWASATWVSGIDPTFVGGSVSWNQDDIAVPDAMRHGAWGMSHPEHMDNTTRNGFAGLDYTQLVHLAILDNVQFGGEMSELDDAGTYFDLPVHKATGAGTYHYMCTRNNNFSNRSQKGMIQISFAPETSQQMGLNGGSMWIDTNEGAVSQDLTKEEQMILAGYTMKVPPLTLKGSTTMSMQVVTDLAGAKGSDVMRVDPPDLVSQFRFPDTPMVSPGRRDRRAGEELTSVQTKIQIVNATTVWFSIESPDFETLATNADRTTDDFHVWVKFHDTDGVTHDNIKVYLNNQFDAEGMWDAGTCSRIQKFEQGKMWMTVMVDGSEYTARLVPEEGSGEPIEITMPVAVAMKYGDVFRYPDTPEAMECLEGTRSSGCSFLRQRVDNAKVSGGEAKFWVSGSQCLQAGGLYVVSEGSNLPIIVGVTVACALLALVAVGAAVYFRKHPEKWSSAKAWGPTKYKLLKRSFASQV